MAPAFLKSCLAIAAVLALAGPAVAQRQEVVMSAASSLTVTLSALKPAAERYVGASLVMNFGSSGTLRSQIEQGAPVDVFFSASAAHMDTLERAGLIVPGSRKNILSNAMILAGDGTRTLPVTLGELPAILSSARLLAIGNPDTVPAGAYAVEALRSSGLYAAVERKLVLGGTARQVLQFVESGAAPLGIVFLTDILSASGRGGAVRLYRFPDSALAVPIRYPAAIVSASKRRDAAARLIAFFSTDEARLAFAEAGFGIP